MVSNPYVETSGEERRDFRLKVTAASIFLCAAACQIAVLINAPEGFRSFWLHVNGVVTVATVASPAILLLASVYLFHRPCPGYILGLFAGFLAVSSLVWRESFNFYFSNPWIGLNLRDTGNAEFISFSKYRILTALMTLMAFGIAFIRLLPERLSLRRRPLRERTWPAFAVSFLATGLWFFAAAMPYRIPIIVEAYVPEIIILHVVKHGLQFKETSVYAARDARFGVSRNHRRFFSYRSPTTLSTGLLPERLVASRSALLNSPQLQQLPRSSAEPLRKWEGEGWYVRLKGSRISAFTSENGMTPPAGIVAFFREVQDLPTTEQAGDEIKDVCLGFCYDPVAGLGKIYVNERCSTGANNVTHCL